jgi:DNA-binding NarL/FixJ family response regulator
MTEREERLRNALRAEDDLIKALQRRVEYYMCHPSHKDVLIGDLRQIFAGQSAMRADTAELARLARLRERAAAELGEV